MNQQELDDLEYITKMASDEFLNEYELVMKSRISELEAANFSLKIRIEALDFQLDSFGGWLIEKNCPTSVLNEFRLARKINKKG